MEEVGVEAIVKGLSAFLGDMGKINSSLQGVRGEGTLLQRAFGAVTDGILSFGEHVARVAEVALGVLLRDAIRAAVDFVKELISVTIDAGNEFQVLELRLQRLNFNTLVESGIDYNDATRQSIDLTKEQLKWLQLLAAQSPYDATDVANVFTLARSYGFAGDAAQHLTQDILDFSSGMGLSNVEVKRIIINFGQMVQQGKVTQRELNDLARGAFVPVNDVLKIMSEQTGVAIEDMDDFRKEGESVGAFMEAFSTLVEQRFSGAMEQMAQTFKASTDNVLDLVKGIGGLQIVKPVLDVIGKRVSDFANAFTDVPERWERLQWAARRVGGELSRLVSQLLGFLPSTDSLADAVVRAVEGIADFIRDNRQNVIDFFLKIGSIIQNNIVPIFTDHLLPAFYSLQEWFYNNRNVITLFFEAVRDIFSEFISDLLGGQGPAKNFGDTITKIMWFIIENKDAIVKWLEVLWSVFVVWQVITTVLSIVGSVLISVIGFVLSLVAGIAGLIGVVEFVIPILGAVAAAIGAIGLPVIALIAAIGVLTYMVVKNWDQIKTTTQQLWFIIKYHFGLMAQAVAGAGTQMWESIKSSISRIVTSFQNINWTGLGHSIAQGISNGLIQGARWIVNAAKNAAYSAYNAALSALGIHSPSKLFFEIGENTMQGMAMGIQKAAGLAAVSMQGAMARVASASIPSVTNSTIYNSTANYNLTVNSAAQTEPITQDFSMMQSLAGV